MYWVFVTLAGIGVIMAALAAITALARSLAERRVSGLHKPVGSRKALKRLKPAAFHTENFEERRKRR